jgi:hypothetical protein
VIRRLLTAAWLLVAVALLLISLGNLVFSIAEAGSEENRAPAVLIVIAAIGTVLCAWAFALAVSTAVGRWARLDAAGGGLLLTAAALIFVVFFELAAYGFVGNT